MLRKFVGAAGAVLLLAGCSTTVPGTPVADPSAVPRPDTGSYATAPRQVGAMTPKVQLAAEAFRMMEVVPLAPDIDSKLRYASTPSVGQMPALVKSEYGDGVGTALADHEVGVTTGASDKVPGSDSSASYRSMITGLFRFKDEAAARAAVANPSVMQPDKGFGSDAPTPKDAVVVPGYADAKAYAAKGQYSTSTVGLLASGRFVLASWTTGSVELIKTFFDLQLKSLNGFVPTPPDKLSTLTRDHDDLLKYTLVEESPTVYQATFTARAIAAFQTDITSAVKDFADAGVDYVANAGSTVYRARDAAGASLLSDRFIDETAAFRAGSSEGKVRGVPGGRCLTYPQYQGSKDTKTYCTVPVGRYVAEISDSQQARAQQALGASYLILQGAK